MLVSAIMPTRGRPQFVAAALACFDSQTWPEKELVIADDADKPSFPPRPERAGVYIATLTQAPVQYHLLTKRLSIGAKRNICCSRARGQIIIHLDDDDWSAPERFADQVERLLASGKPITAYNSMEFRGEKGRFRYDGYPVGTSLCYMREWWREHPFLDQGPEGTGEDGAFTDNPYCKHVVSVAAGELMWASYHQGNSSQRDFRASQWTRL